MRRLLVAIFSRIIAAILQEITKAYGRNRRHVAVNRQIEHVHFFAFERAIAIPIAGGKGLTKNCFSADFLPNIKKAVICFEASSFGCSIIWGTATQAIQYSTVHAKNMQRG